MNSYNLNIVLEFLKKLGSSTFNFSLFDIH